MLDIITKLQECFINISNEIRYKTPWDLSKPIEINNSSGDSIKKLDDYSNKLIIDRLSQCPDIRFLASEEENDLIEFNSSGKYLMSIDPVDGSSNIKNNIGVGSIFCLFEYSNNKTLTGRDIVLSGYCLYSNNTTLVLCMGGRLNIYQLDFNNNFNLIKDNFKMPFKGDSYAINESSREKWNNPKLVDYIEQLKLNKKTQRWVGSLVADANRIINSGGVFIYPGNKKSPDGKIRLLYEAYPFAHIIETAGGYSSDGTVNILDIPYPKKLHSRTPIFLFSKSEFNIFKNIYI